MSGDSLLRAFAAGGGALDAYGGAGVVLVGVFSWGPGRGATWLMAKSGPYSLIIQYLLLTRRSCVILRF